TGRLEHSRKSAGFEDIARLAVPDHQKLYTWWSYRAADWAASNRGRRLDHIWANTLAMEDVQVSSYMIHPIWRGGWKPSDHAPVSLTLKA
ncbi:MAG: exodeoxyribonuclease III, partial [Pseudomonadota bacterium]